jgi:predicted transcriptional regulator
MKSVSLKLPDDLNAKLEQVSRERGAAKSDVVRDALDAYFAGQTNGRQLSCADLAAEIIGSVTGPVDLATNPKHMRGFGQ